MSHISTSFKPAERDMREWICVVVIVDGPLYSIPKSDQKKNALVSSGNNVLIVRITFSFLAEKTKKRKNIQNFMINYILFY